MGLFVLRLKSFEKVLVLSTSIANNAPVLTDVNGRDDAVNFTFGEKTEVYGSCSVQESLLITLEWKSTLQG